MPRAIGKRPKRQKNRRPIMYGYARVSTREQAEGGHSVDNQITVVRERWERDYREKYDWGGVYVDRGVSGKKKLAKRGEGAKLLAVLERGDAVICNDISRMSRSMGDFVLTVGEWVEHNISLVLVRGNLDLTTSAGRLMAHILVSFAEFEREMVSVRTKEVFERRRQLTGRASMSRPAPYGYRKIRKRNSVGRYQTFYAPNPEERSLGGHLLGLREVAGWSVPRIMEHLNIEQKLMRGKKWTLRKIYRVIKFELALREIEARIAEAEGKVNPSFVLTPLHGEVSKLPALARKEFQKREISPEQQARMQAGRRVTYDRVTRGFLYRKYEPPMAPGFSKLDRIEFILEDDSDGER